MTLVANSLTRTQRARNELARVMRRNHATDDERADARRNLAFVKVDEFIDRALAGAPPLTNDQIEAITARLRGAATEAAN